MLMNLVLLSLRQALRVLLLRMMTLVAEKTVEQNTRQMHLDGPLVHLLRHALCLLKSLLKFFPRSLSARTEDPTPDFWILLPEMVQEERVLLDLYRTPRRLCLSLKRRMRNIHFDPTPSASRAASPPCAADTFPPPWPPTPLVLSPIRPSPARFAAAVDDCSPRDGVVELLCAFCVRAVVPSMRVALGSTKKCTNRARRTAADYQRSRAHLEDVLMAHSDGRRDRVRHDFGMLIHDIYPTSCAYSTSKRVRTGTGDSVPSVDGVQSVSQLVTVTKCTIRDSISVSVSMFGFRTQTTSTKQGPPKSQSFSFFFSCESRSKIRFGSWLDIIVMMMPENHAISPYASFRSGHRLTFDNLSAGPRHSVCKTSGLGFVERRDCRSRPFFR